LEKDKLRPGVTWVTPTRRLAHYLRIRHDEACDAEGLEVWTTPDVVTWSGLVERLFVDGRAAGRVSGRWLDDALARLAWERIAERDGALSHLLSPGLLGRTAYDSWRRMHAYAIPLGALDADDRPEAQAFARWARTYAQWLRRHGWVDESRALELVDPELAVPALELAGFEAFTPAQRSLLERLRQAGVTVTERAVATRRGAQTLTACRDRNAEFDTAARWAAAKLETDPGLRIAVVVPDLSARRDEVRRIVERIVAPATALAGGPAPETEAFELVAARTFADWAIVAAALDILGAFTRGTTVADATRLLASPFLASAPGEDDARARLDAFIRREEGPELGLGRLEKLAATASPALAQALRASLESAADWPGRARPSEWARRFSRLLATMGWPGTDLDSDEHQARQRWQQLVGEFGACDDAAGTISPREAASLIADMARGTSFQPQELRAPLTIIDPETCAGMDFDALWLCGLEAGQWPPAASPDAFLPRDWQARQRVPGATADQCAADARALFERICRSADEVVLSYPRYDADAPLLPSTFVGELASVAAAPIWPLSSLANATFDARPPLEVCVDGAMPAIGAADAARGGARLLELQAACPFRAQAELRLGARALEEPEAGIAAADRGDLVHAVLASVWGQLREQVALRALDAPAARTLVRAAISRETEAARAPAHSLRTHLLAIEAEWLEARVIELLDADRARPDFSIESLEQTCRVALGGLELTLRIDRVDRLADGTLAVIDYKTGNDADPQAWLGERPQLPQLPLYSQAVGREHVSAVAFGRVRAGDTGYVGLASGAGAMPGLKDPSTRGWPKEYATWGELQAAWARRLEGLAEEYARGEARLAPDPTHACRYCHLAALCRIEESALAGTAEGDDGE
jgi:probable DNA repair protein